MSERARRARLEDPGLDQLVNRRRRVGDLSNLTALRQRGSVAEDGHSPGERPGVFAHASQDEPAETPGLDPGNRLGGAAGPELAQELVYQEWIASRAPQHGASKAPLPPGGERADRTLPERLGQEPFGRGVVEQHRQRLAPVRRRGAR